MLLDQDVKFGGQVPPCPNTVHLTGEQRRYLKQKGTRALGTRYGIVF